MMTKKKKRYVFITLVLVILGRLFNWKKCVRIQIEETVTDGKAEPITDLRQKINERKQESKQNEEGNKNSPSIVDELNDIMDKKHDEDALDFEAEDGECEEKEPQAPPKGDKEGLYYLGAVSLHILEAVKINLE